MSPYVKVSLPRNLVLDGSSLPLVRSLPLFCLSSSSSSSFSWPPPMEKEWRIEEGEEEERKKVDPSLMPRRAGHGWNFKQRHVVELGISGLFCSIRP